MSKEKLKKLTTKIQMPKSNNGITLVALIITIVVMLILVTVTLSVALGQNGVVNTAKDAAEKTDISKEKEQLLDAIFATAGSNGEVNLEDIVLPEGFTEVVGSVSYASKVTYQGPSGQQYQVDKVTGEITEADGENAGEPVDLNDGYKVTYGDYEYTYSSKSQGWSVAVLDKTKEEYGKIATAIYGKPIISLANTFNGCSNLKIAPEIPSGVTSLYCSFANCSSLEEAPTIPEGITSLFYTFHQCYSLEIAPEIPKSVTDMQNTFYGCSSLTNAPEIPEGVTNMYLTFYACSNLIEAPVIPKSVTNMACTFKNCRALKTAPIIPNGVTNMNETFNGCHALTQISEIPENVDNMKHTFNDCRKLQGEIIINATPTTYTGCFASNAGIEGAGIVLKGSSTVLNELAATNTHGKVTVGN